MAGHAKKAWDAAPSGSSVIKGITETGTALSKHALSPTTTLESSLSGKPPTPAGPKAEQAEQQKPKAEKTDQPKPQAGGGESDKTTLDYFAATSMLAVIGGSLLLAAGRTIANVGKPSTQYKGDTPPNPRDV